MKSHTDLLNMDVNDLTLSESLTLIRLYVDSVLKGYTLPEMLTGVNIRYLLERYDFVTSAHFEALVLPLLPPVGNDRRKYQHRRTPRPPVLYALQHHSCPPHVLSDACRRESHAYSLVASQNVNCPLIDATYVALAYETWTP